MCACFRKLLGRQPGCCCQTLRRRVTQYENTAGFSFGTDSDVTCSVDPISQKLRSALLAEVFLSPLLPTCSELGGGPTGRQLTVCEVIACQHIAKSSCRHRREQDTPAPSVPSYRRSPCLRWHTAWCRRPAGADWCWHCCRAPHKNRE